MKNILYILAVLTLVACSKSEVAYDTANEGELVVVPAACNITKAAITDGIYPEENHISLFAFHAPGISSGAVTDYSMFVETYLYDTEYFYTGADQSTKIWGGLKSSYYWPITGSLVFAGYSLDAPTTVGERAESSKIGTKVVYTLADDKLEIEGYTQSLDPASTFDFLYFGRTQNSYNNRRTGDPIALEFKHALSWITIEVLGGEGALIDGHVWSVTNVKLAGVQNIGDFTYTGTATDTKVEWDTPTAASDAEFVVFAGSKPLTDEMTAIEDVTNATLVIPQPATMLYVTIQYLSPANDTITEVIEIDLSEYTTAGWEAGKRYTYKLTFAPSEIIVAPIVETWPDPIVSTPQF